MDLPEKHIAIDEEGYALFGEIRVTDADVGRSLLENLTLSREPRYSLQSEIDGQRVFVEAFDEPLVVQMVEKHPQGLLLTCPYGLTRIADISKLTVDKWDRFHGYTTQGIPFVLSRKAQSALFNLADSFDDDSITISGIRHRIPPYWTPQAQLNSSGFWSDIWSRDSLPEWDIRGPTPALVEMLPRLKLPPQRVLVPGCGGGHDAFLFAEAGHFVTALDISPLALERAQRNYGPHPRLRWLQGDILQLDSRFNEGFDIIFEHTLFCAIDPTRREELIRSWSRLLQPTGHLMGVFFTMEKREGPPFGATEWEIRELLKSRFQFLFWARWRKSIPPRQGKELFVYARKRTS
ncbi:MAG: TPMT family class I SAM-dependent methyltransferase [Bdellovibrionaceae bacterium]|nr:TPMT family class I SAM-dependent methyltransferase [Pseudobdellovibrionaceae bacterium]